MIVGRSGSSKSTILMELMCDYFDAGYEILYNNGVTDIKNTYGLVNFIENRLRNGKEIVVAIDDAHNERANSIFYVLDKVSNSQLTKNLRFIITARLPEFDWLLERLDRVQEETRKSIRKLVGDPKFRYYLPYFTRDEIKDFMRLYLGIIDDYVTDNKSQEIYHYTKGDPIMVKFSVFGQGLEQDVEEMHDRYLRPQLEMKTMLICSLLDISNIEIIDDVLEACGVLEGAYRLNGATLYRNSEGKWSTKHPRWDEELFSFLYNKNSGTLTEQRKRDLKDSLMAICSIKEEDIIYSAVGALYYIAAQNFIPINIADTAFHESISHVPTYLCDDEKKSNLYTDHIARAYYQLKKYQEFIDKLNHALKLNPRNIVAYDMKGLSLMKLGKLGEAVECFEKELEIDPNLVSVWVHKGDALDESQDHEKALTCFDKALEIDPNYADAWVEKGVCLNNIGKYEEAIESYDKALEILRHLKSLATHNTTEGLLSYLNSLEAKSWSLRGHASQQMRKYYDGIYAYNMSLSLHAADADTWVKKGNCHLWLGIIDTEENEVAIKCYDEALKIDPGHANAKYFKGLALSRDEQSK